jgi:SAM-dependent methyltransferase
VGKKSVQSKSPRERLDRDIERIFRRLNVPFGGDIEAVLAEAERRLGPEQVKKWDKHLEDRMTMALADIETAIVLGVGIRERLLRKELPWICEQILRTSEPNDQILEVGSGTGFAAACIQRLTNRRVMATDVVPDFAPVAIEMAARVQADVHTVVTDIAGAGKMLDGARPDVALAQAVIGYAVTSHKHQPGLTWPGALAQRFRQPEDLGPDVQAFVDLPSKCLLMIDFFCLEVVGTFIGLAARRGMSLSLEHTERFNEMVYGTPAQQIALCFETTDDVVLPDPIKLLDILDLGTAEQLHFGMEYSEWKAESRFGHLATPEHAWHWSDQRQERYTFLGRDGEKCYEYSTWSGGKRLLQLVDVDLYPDLVEQTTAELEGQGASTLNPAVALLRLNV